MYNLMTASWYLVKTCQPCKTDTAAMSCVNGKLITYNVLQIPHTTEIQENLLSKPRLIKYMNQSKVWKD